MNIDLDTYVQAKIYDIIQDWNKDVVGRIEVLNNLKKRTSNPDYIRQIDIVIEKLSTVSNLSYGKLFEDTQLIENNHLLDKSNKRYDYLQSRYDKRGEKAEDWSNKMQEQANEKGKVGWFSQSRQARNHDRQIVIKNKQMRFTEKKMAEKLLEYQTKKQISIKEIDKFILKTTEEINEGKDKKLAEDAAKYDRIRNTLASGESISRSDRSFERSMERKDRKVRKEVVKDIENVIKAEENERQAALAQEERERQAALAQEAQNQADKERYEQIKKTDPSKLSGADWIFMTQMENKMLAEKRKAAKNTQQQPAQPTQPAQPAPTETQPTRAQLIAKEMAKRKVVTSNDNLNKSIGKVSKRITKKLQAAAEKKHQEEAKKQMEGTPRQGSEFFNQNSNEGRGR